MEGFLSSLSLVPALFLSLLRRDTVSNFLRHLSPFPLMSTLLEHSCLLLETIIKLLWPPPKQLLI